MSSRKNAMAKLFEIIDFFSDLQGAKGFGHVLGLTPPTLSASHLRFDYPTLTAQISVGPHLVMGQSQHQRNQLQKLPRNTVDSITSNTNNSKQIEVFDFSSISLSTYLAIIDEVTGWCLIMSDPDRRRGGVSVSLRARRGGRPTSTEESSSTTANTTTVAKGELTPLGEQSSSISEEISKSASLEIVATASKVGRTLGFTQAEIRVRSDPTHVGSSSNSHEYICLGSHIKYLPLGLMADFLMSTNGWPFAKLYQSYLQTTNAATKQNNNNSQNSPPTLDEIFQSFQYDPDRGLASFETNEWHTNPAGGLHGGVQAILMEKAATQFILHHSPNGGSKGMGSTDAPTASSTTTMPPSLILEAISIEYMSVPNNSRVELSVRLMSGSTESESVLDYPKANVIIAQVTLLVNQSPKSIGELVFTSCMSDQLRAAL